MPLPPPLTDTPTSVIQVILSFSFQSYRNRRTDAAGTLGGLADEVFLIFFL
jgi:hypothetical protein